MPAEALETVTIKDALGAVSLVFTVLAFFVGRRIDRFDAADAGGSGAMGAVEALLEFVLSAVAVLAIIILWPLLEGSEAFRGFSATDNVLPNLLAVVAAGFAALAIIEGSLGIARVVPRAFDNVLTAVVAVLLVSGAIAAVLLLLLA